MDKLLLSSAYDLEYLFQVGCLIGMPPVLELILVVVLPPQQLKCFKEVPREKHRGS